MKKIVLSIFVLVALSSCSIYQKYSRPAEITTDNLYGKVVSKDTTTIADISWRDFFTDKYLQGYIEQGLKSNIDIKIATERIRQSQASLRAAKMGFAPSVNFSPSFSTSSDKSGSSVGGALPISASWEIDILGRQLNRKRSADVSLAQSKVYHRSVQTALIAAIADNYYTLLMLDAQLAVSRSTAASWKENVRTMKAMKEAGMTNEASISQTEANACSVDASLYDLEYKIIQAENSLALLLGTTPQHFKRGKLDSKVPKGKLLMGVPAQLLSRRPDVQEAEYNLQLAFYNTNIARADLYPSLTISGDGGWASASSFFFNFAAKLLQPIFQAGKLRTNLRIAESRQREALENFRHKLLEAGNEVNTALAQCRSARSKINIRKQQIAALESAVYSTRQLMSHSEATYLEVLTAQQSQLSARLQQIEDRYEGIQGMIKLYRALGGGSEEPNVPVEPFFGKCKRVKKAKAEKPAKKAKAEKPAKEVKVEEPAKEAKAKK